LIMAAPSHVQIRRDRLKGLKHSGLGATVLTHLLKKIFDTSTLPLLPIHNSRISICNM
jgi:hypothetical protein